MSGYLCRQCDRPVWDEGRDHAPDCPKRKSGREQLQDLMKFRRDSKREGGRG